MGSCAEWVYRFQLFYFLSFTLSISGKESNDKLCRRRIKYLAEIAVESELEERCYSLLLFPRGLWPACLGGVVGSLLGLDRHIGSFHRNSISLTLLV